MVRKRIGTDDQKANIMLGECLQQIYEVGCHLVATYLTCDIGLRSGAKPILRARPAGFEATTRGRRPLPQRANERL
jgi:hypothetical protein